MDQPVRYPGIPLFRLFGNQLLEISFDVLNFNNLLGNALGQDDWGVQRTASNAVVTELTFQAYEVTEASDGTLDLTPGMSFDPDRVPTNMDQYNISNINSRWRAQLGLRYSFRYDQKIYKK